MAYDSNKGMVAVATGYSGDYRFTKIDNYMQIESLNITPDIIQEMDSYRNANGRLKRPNIMPCVSSKIEFNTPFCSKKTMNKFMQILQDGTHVKGGVPEENKIRIRFWNQKQIDYNYAWAYYPDLQFNTYTTSSGRVMYNPLRVAFITYGEKR